MRGMVVAAALSLGGCGGSEPNPSGGADRPVADGGYDMPGCDRTRAERPGAKLRDKLPCVLPPANLPPDWLPGGGTGAHLVKKRIKRPAPVSAPDGGPTP